MHIHTRATFFEGTSPLHLSLVQSQVYTCDQGMFPFCHDMNFIFSLFSIAKYFGDGRVGLELMNKISIGNLTIYNSSAS